MKKKILHIDMDGVLADFAKAVMALSPTTNLQFWSKEVDDICAQNPRIFLKLEPIKDAIVSVNQLFDLFDVYFLSTPMWHIPESYTDKRLWLEKFFGEQAEKKLILTHRKDLVTGDYIIDDTTRHGVDEFKGIHLHFGSEIFPDWKTLLPYIIINLSKQ